MLRYATALVLITLLVTVVPAAKDGKILVNVDGNGLALQGFDPVAYHKVGRATKGDAAFTATHEGATYQFASAENRDLFQGNPQKYAPMFGGFCSWAVSRKYTAGVDVNAFGIADGKLYLNYNEDVLKQFDKNRDVNLKKARENWPGLVQSKGR